MSMSMRTRALRYGVAGAILATVCVGVVADAEADPVLEWKRQFGTDRDEEATGIATDAAGNVYLTGYTRGSLGGANSGYIDAWVAKYDAAGTRLWTRQLGTYSGDEATGIATDAAGNVYLTGSTGGSLGGANRGGWRDAWVAKYDAAGTRLWTRQLGTYRADVSTGVATDAAGNVYLSGWTWGKLDSKYVAIGYNPDAWIAKYDAGGNPQWRRQLGTEWTDEATGVATDAAGNVYLTGITSGSLGGPNSGAYGIDAWIVKYDAAGNSVWTRQLGTKDHDYATGVATDAAGNVYLTGLTGGSLGGANRGYIDAWVAKYDAGGNPQWRRQLGTEWTDQATGVATDAAGDVYLTGYSQGSMGGANRGRDDAWIAKYDAAGNARWKRQIGTKGLDRAWGVATDATGNVYLTGGTKRSLGGANRGGFDAWVAKLTPND